MTAMNGSPQEGQRYEYRVAAWRARGRIVYAAILMLLALYGIYEGVHRHQPALIVFGVSIPIIIIFLHMQLRRVVRYIQFLPDSRIEFGRWGGSTVLAASDLRSLRPPKLGYGVATLRYSGGKLLVVTQMDGWSEALATLRQLNPSVDIRGF